MSTPAAAPEQVATEVVTQDPAATQAAPVQTTPVVQGGPWQSDLAEFFSDADTRNQVDSFLRQKVQPHVTRLEQDRSVDQAAQQLYRDLNDDPIATYLALSEEIYGPEATEAVRTSLQSFYDQQETPPAAETTEPPAPLDPRVEALLQKEAKAEAEKAYAAELARVKGDDNPDGVVDAWFHPFVVTAEGDFDAALTGYKQWLADAGVQTPASTQVTEPTVPAPAVIGSDVTPGTPPPVQKTYGSLDEAFEDYFAEQRAAAPAPVGVT